MNRSIRNVRKYVERRFSEKKQFESQSEGVVESPSSVYNFPWGTTLPGFATSEGTKKYASRNARISKDNFRSPFHSSDMKLSRLGYGSYMGDPTKEHDQQMLDSVVRCVESGGVNVLDTAINYRYMKSERTIGEAIRLLKERGVGREELFVCTKGGFLSKDADREGFSDSELLKLLESGAVAPEDIVANVHCMNPKFLENQLHQSLENLGLDSVDVYYIHNPAEVQLALIGEEKFYERVSQAFELLERKRKEGKIQYYGLATWNCFRSPPEEKGVHVNLEKVVRLAESVGGKSHGFKYVQTPINGMMMESFAFEWQNIDSQIFAEDNKLIAKKFNVDISKLKPHSTDPKTSIGFLRACRLLGVNVMTSSTLMQGQVLKFEMDKSVFNSESNSGRHIQFIRSIPDEAIISNLVGMKSQNSVEQNLDVTLRDNVKSEAFFKYIQSFNPAQ